MSREIVVPFIAGDGVAQKIMKAYQTSGGLFRAIPRPPARVTCAGQELLAGEVAFKSTGSWLPPETLAAIKEHGVALKGR